MEGPGENSIAKKPGDDMEVIRSIIGGVENILRDEGTNKGVIRKRVAKFLEEQGAPFVDFTIEEDRERSDGGNFCVVYIHVPKSWHKDTETDGKSTILCTVPDTYEPEQHA